MNTDNLNYEFYSAYHINPLLEQAKALQGFLDGLPEEMKLSRHFNYLSREMTRVQRDYTRAGSPDELPGMVYGMWCEAWRQLLEEFSEPN